MKGRPDPRRQELLLGWLRRARACPDAGGLVLRGSLMLGAICPGARPAMDVDYVVPGAFDPAACERLARAIVACPDAGTRMFVDRCEVIFGETEFPGLRAFVEGESALGAAAFQVDLGFGDPLPQPARAVLIPGAGEVLACTAETLFGWKVHGLVEYGRGKWRAKDLFDLWLLCTRVPLDEGALRAAVHLAFESRRLDLSALDDLRTRPTWGESRSGRKKWKSFVNRHPDAPGFTEARELVKVTIEALLSSPS